MATFATCILNHQRKKDGTYPIRLRITHKRVVKWLNTNLVATPEDLTRGMNIKNTKLARQCQELTYTCIDISNDLGYRVEEMTPDELVTYIRLQLSGGDRFRLDFFQFIERSIEKMNPGTASLYRTTANTLRRYVGCDTLDVSEITNSFVRGFVRFIEEEPSQRGANRQGRSEQEVVRKGSRALSLYLTRVKTMYMRAKEEYNDEDAGIINIQGNPFRNIRINTPPPTAKRAVSPEVIQQIINLPEQPTRRMQLARDCFLISFALMGMNSVDMLACVYPQKNIVTYNRQKTSSRRADNAEMRVRIEPCVEPLLRRYSDATKRRLFHFYLSYSNRETFNAAINKGLKEIGAQVGVDDLTFYAARHSWATIARAPRRREGDEEIGGAGLDKYLVHEALNHVDPAMRVTDIYLSKNWQLLWDANKAVLELFDWRNIE